MSSSICSHFTQNAWKKDLCSNCFKSKDEHKTSSSTTSAMSKFYSFNVNSKSSNSSSKSNAAEQTSKKTDYPNKHKTPSKSIIKKSFSISSSKKSKSQKVSFPKNIYEVIGYGGEWSDDSDDDHDFMNLANDRDDSAATSTDDEETVEIKRITRANTDFNMVNGNLLGDPQDNIKKSFMALKLGAPQVDKEGKKQTLKINVQPFGVNATAEQTKQIVVTTATSVKAKFESKAEIKSISKTNGTPTKTNAKKTTEITANLKPITSSTATTSVVTTKNTKAATSINGSDGTNSPPIERAMEKSLLDEISETLEQKQNESKKLASEKDSMNSNASSKIKFEITSLSDTMENKPFLELKKPIARNVPITKEHTKPKINVFHKYSDSDSNCSDAENGVSAYYDVVETQVSYENLPDGKCQPKPKSNNVTQSEAAENESIFSSSQYITDMLLSSKTRAASYNLHEGAFITSKVNSEGLVVTKCSSDDALDSTGSSFDGSSDEENSYNVLQGESDSGIGISIGNDYKNINIEQRREHLLVEKTLSVSTNNSDYEDIQVSDQLPVLSKLTTKTTESPKKPKANYMLDKSRELHGEPDGSADPDGSLESKETLNTLQQLPALPKSPPPTKIIDARTSFLHGLQKQHPPVLLKKPDLPAKPLVSPTNSPLKLFSVKQLRQTSNTTAEQQVINQLQMVMSKSNENLSATNSESAKDDAKLKKGKAPNPPPEQKLSAPPTPERDYNIDNEFEKKTKVLEAAETKDTAAKLITPKMSTMPKAVDSETYVETMSVSLTTEKGNKTEMKNTTVSTVNENATRAKITTANATVNLYTRKASATSTVASNNNKTTSSSPPVIKEKDKRERATVNPKFRSLNTFATQRSNTAKNLQLQSSTPTTPLTTFNLKQQMTPEMAAAAKKQKSLSVSEECLAVIGTSFSATPKGSEKKSTMQPQTPTTPTKTKTKFSIKKFLRMGASKTTDNVHKKESIYSEICTGEETNVAGKPRLVIIHPIDINPTAVEVVKDITKTGEAVKTQTVPVVTSKPPAPPLRATEGQRAHDINKPARPPPPKSAELRRKQKIALTATTSASGVDEAGLSGGSLKSKADNVYANLGEIRSSIAPRKPERTASMREREAQLELARKRHVGSRNENADTISICSSNGDNVSKEQFQQYHEMNSVNSNTNSIRSVTDGKPPSGSRTSTFERRKSDPKIAIANKLEIFENRGNSANNNNADTISQGSCGRPPSLKESVRKINSTIDSYLKDKREYENMYEYVKSTGSPPPPPARSVDISAAANAAAQRLLPPRRNNLYSDTTSIASYTRSEYGPVRSYGLNSSLANIPRIVSTSCCGSEMGEFDIYAPYSYYGSETGGDVSNDINDSVWGIPSAAKNRTKATNRLRMRKGRSVVHKTIEDNYTAVVVANHEALAQVLDQLQQTPIIPPALRPLANAINLRFEDFTILDGAQAFVVGKKAFHAAIWTTAAVTLVLSADCNQLSGVGRELNQLSGGVSGVLNPITEFCDLVPSYHLPLMPSTEVTLMQATISVLPRLQLDSLQSIGAILKGKSQVLDKSNFNFRGSIPNLSGLKDNINTIALRNVVSVQNLSTLNEESSEKSTNAALETEVNTLPGMPSFDDVMTREVAFIMLQLVNGMKNLQAKAMEEMPLSLSNVVLSKDVENKDAQARLCVLQGNNNDEDEPMGTLCKCAHIALSELLPHTKITSMLGDILQQERAESLSKAKSVLEFVLWGPSDVVLSGSAKERELALQRWLDLERATVLHGLVRTRIELTVYDECHLMFLVRSTAKMMNDAAKLVCSYQQTTAEQ